MQVSKPVKVLVGLGTAWTLFYPVLFLVAGILTVLMTEEMANTMPEMAIPFSFMALASLHCLTMLVSVALMGFYLYHIIRNTIAPDVIRIIFAIGIFFIPFIVMPLYYYVFIWRDEPPEWILGRGKPDVIEG